MFNWLVLKAGAAGQFLFMRLLKTIVIRAVAIQTSPQEDVCYSLSVCKDTLLRAPREASVEMILAEILDISGADFNLNNTHENTCISKFLKDTYVLIRHLPIRPLSI